MNTMEDAVAPLRYKLANLRLAGWGSSAEAEALTFVLDAVEGGEWETKEHGPRRALGGGRFFVPLRHRWVGPWIQGKDDQP